MDLGPLAGGPEHRADQVAQAWDPQKVMGKTTIVRPRNSSTDLRTYHFEYLDRLWEQNPQLRQLVVQATDYKGRTIQVALLTDDLQRPAAEAIHLMFERWLQENDFKYLVTVQVCGRPPLCCWSLDIVRGPPS